MLNSAPNNSKYTQGNYIPKYKDKVLKLNTKGGVYFRSSWERKIMMWLDHKKEIVKWGAECMVIPYETTEFNNGDDSIKIRNYYPDFYYELKREDGSISKVVAEVKPWKEFEMAMNFSDNKLNIPEVKGKKLKNFEYDFKMAYKNKQKWETMIKWCDKKGYKFIVITEKFLNKIDISNIIKG